MSDTPDVSNPTVIAGREFLTPPTDEPVSLPRQALLDALAHGKESRIGLAKMAATNWLVHLTDTDPLTAATLISVEFATMVKTNEIYIDGRQCQLTFSTLRWWKEIRRQQVPPSSKLGSGIITALNPHDFPEPLIWAQCPPRSGMMIWARESADHLNYVLQRAEEENIPVGMITSGVNSAVLRIFVHAEHGEAARDWLRRILKDFGIPTADIILSPRIIQWRPINVMAPQWRDAIIESYTQWLNRRLRPNDVNQLRHHILGESGDVKQWIAGTILELMTRYDDTCTTRTGKSMPFPAFLWAKVPKLITDLQRDRLSRRGAETQTAIHRYADAHGIHSSDVPDEVVAELVGVPVHQARKLRQAYLSAMHVHTPIPYDAPVFEDDPTSSTYLETVAQRDLGTSADPAVAAVTQVDPREAEDLKMPILSSTMVEASDEISDPLAFYCNYATAFLKMDPDIVASLANISPRELERRTREYRGKLLQILGDTGQDWVLEG